MHASKSQCPKHFVNAHTSWPCRQYKWHTRRGLCHTDGHAMWHHGESFLESPYASVMHTVMLQWHVLNSVFRLVWHENPLLPFCFDPLMTACFAVQVDMYGILNYQVYTLPVHTISLDKCGKPTYASPTTSWAMSAYSMYCAIHKWLKCNYILVCGFPLW